jgi:hypothetical protein
LVSDNCVERSLQPSDDGMRCSFDLVHILKAVEISAVVTNVRVQLTPN